MTTRNRDLGVGRALGTRTTVPMTAPLGSHAAVDARTGAVSIDAGSELATDVPRTSPQATSVETATVICVGLRHALSASRATTTGVRTLPRLPRRDHVSYGGGGLHAV